MRRAPAQPSPPAHIAGPRGRPAPAAPAVSSRAFIQQTFTKHSLRQDSAFKGRGEGEFSPPTDPIRISQDRGVGVGS